MENLNTFDAIESQGDVRTLACLRWNFHRRYYSPVRDQLGKSVITVNQTSYAFKANDMAFSRIRSLQVQVQV